VHRFTIFADYFQVVLMDERSGEPFPETWSADALDRMLVVGKSVASIGTLRNVDVPVEIQVLDAAPALDYSEWDHAVEGSIEVPSGSLVVMSCTGYLPDAPRVPIASGTYQLVFLARGLGTIDDEAGPADNLYRVCSWLGPAQAPNLIKSWRSANA